MSDRLLHVVERRRAGLALAAGLGAVAATGQAPLGWAWATLAALAVAIPLFLMPARWQVVAWRGWAFGAGYFAVALSWIVEPFLINLARHGWMAPFALILMAGGLALFWALAFGVAAAFGRGHRARVLLLVAALTAAEMLRSVIFTGFPWALIGHVWIGWPQMQLAAVAGAHGLTLLTLVAAALPGFFGARHALIGVIAAVALISLPVGYAKLRVPQGPAPAAEPLQVVRVVQPNAPQQKKWDPDLVLHYYERLLALSGAEADTGLAKPAVVIWPETSVPWLLEDAPPAFRQMADAAGGAKIIAGVQRADLQGRWYNSLVVLTPPEGEVTALYDKHHLVPFGEYMPLMELFARWGIFGLAANDTGGYSAGPGPHLLDLGSAGTILPLICYEAIFPNDIARAPGRADWLVQITNDAWFGHVSGPYQHLALARLRAVEQGLPLFRAANTGVSAAFDPFGRELARVPLDQEGFAEAVLPAPLPPTPYARFGDWPVRAAVALLAALGMIFTLRSRTS